MPASSRSEPRSRSRTTPRWVRPTPGEAIVVADVTPEMERFAGLSSERFRATRTEDGHLRIDTMPWAATDLAFADVVAGEFLGTKVAQDREVPVYGMTHVVHPSGWRNLVAVHETPFSVDRWSAAKKEIRALGAETLHARLHSMAVGVPPDAARP